MNRYARPVCFAMEPDVVSIFALLSFDEVGAPVLNTNYSKGICNADLIEIEITGDLASNTTVSNVSSFEGLYVGMAITGTGIAAATTISNMDSGAGTITLSQAATATASGVELTVSGGLLITFGSQFSPVKRLDTYVRLLGLNALWDETGVQGDDDEEAVVPAVKEILLVSNQVSISGEASLGIMFLDVDGAAVLPAEGEMLRLAIQLTRSTAI